MEQDLRGILGMRTLLTLAFLISLAFSSASSNAGTAKPEHHTLPSGYIYIECSETGCTDDELRSAAVDYVYRYGEGSYDFLLGNVYRSTVFQMTASLRDFCGNEPGCYGGLTLMTSEQAPDPEIVAEFQEYADFLKSYPREINVSGEETGVYSLPRNGDGGYEALLADVQRWILRTWPQFGSPSMFGKSVQLKLKYEDGSEGDYVMILSVYSVKLFWMGTGKDADGNQVVENTTSNEQVLRHEISAEGDAQIAVIYNPVGADAVYTIADSQYVTVKLVCHTDADGGVVCAVKEA